MQQAKLYLAEALLYLMEQHSLSEISIKELVQKAGVSRMTYYRYFSSKESILRFYMTYILQKYQEQVTLSKEQPMQSYLHILESLKFFAKYQHFAKALQKANMDSLLLQELNQYIQTQPSFQNSVPLCSYPYYFYAGALYNIYMQWVAENCSTQPEEIARIINKISKNTLLDFQWEEK